MAEALTYSRRALRAVLQRTTSEEVAARCRVAGQAVRLWAAGDTTPTPQHRDKLAQLYGIPPERWGARPLRDE